MVIYFVLTIDSVHHLNDKEQPRYGFNKRYIYWTTFKGCNSWRVVALVTTNIALAEEEAVYEIIMHRLEARTNARILVGTFGTMRTNDEATQGCYLVKWITELNTVQENTLVKGVVCQRNYT